MGCATHGAIQVVGLLSASNQWLQEKGSQQIITEVNTQRGCAQPDTFHICRDLSLNCSQISPSISSSRHDVGVLFSLHV